VKLADSQSAFLYAADRISPHDWKSKPSAQEWSASEVVAHVVMVERAVLRTAQGIIRKPPREVRFWEQVHLPLWLVEIRLIRLKTPIALDPAMIADKEEMLGELRLTRERTLDFLAQTQNRDLGAYGWTHVFLGRLNLYEWFGMIAAHQVRHTKQIREICERLPKVVENSRNQ